MNNLYYDHINFTWKDVSILNVSVAAVLFLEVVWFIFTATLPFYIDNVISTAIYIK